MATWRITSSDVGAKLVNVIKKKVNQNYSLRRLKSAIEQNCCLVNGKIERFASYKVNTGDSVYFDEAKVDSLLPKFFEAQYSRVLYEDSSLFIYNKPAGISSDEKGLSSLFPQYQLVHRLDRETTGVIVFAKSQKLKELMIELFKDFKVEKTYLAIVDGTFDKSSGVIENFLGKVSSKNQQLRWGVVDASRGNLAKTSWRIIRQSGHASLVKCVPLTGKTHQIRVQMNYLSHPILGDSRYARKFRCQETPKRLMLHASKIAFPHPITGSTIEVEAPLPDDFSEILERLFR